MGSRPGGGAACPLQLVRRTLADTLWSIKGTPTRQFVETGKSRFSGLDEELARQRLRELNAARSLDIFGRLNSVGLHKLKGDRRGSWAIKVNGPWRIVFRFRDGDAYEIEIVDYH
jgi:proteic killer suppression protein